MEFLENYTEETQNSLKRAFMECSIIFTMSKDEKVNMLKGNMFLQSVLALLVDAGVPCSSDQMISIYKQRTGRLINKEQFDTALEQLKNLNYITPGNGGYVVHGQLKALMQKGIDEVDHIYAELVDGMISQLQMKAPEELTEEQQRQSRINIKGAMTLYAKIHGMESLVGESDENDEDDEENSDIIKRAKQGLDELTGNLLVEVLADVIAKPTQFQGMAINLLMQSFIGAQIMQIDPLLGQFDEEKLKDKTFVFDTDFVLNSITKYHSQSSNYRKLIKTLRKIGCNIVIPREVVEEVVRHAQCAERNNSWFANAFETLDEAIVEKEATNVFVKDYYMWKFKTKKTNTLIKFMCDRYYDKSKPYPFMKDVIEEELKCKVLDDPLEIPIELGKRKEELTEKIKQEIKLSFKNKWRDKEETESLAKTDATLYLYALSENGEARSGNNNDILNATSYIITYTTKSIRCAKAMQMHQNIVTRPEILINILQRIGEFDAKNMTGLELFDNPFLTYIMRQYWPTVKKLADFGVDLHGKTITRLEYDLDEILHEMITKEADCEEISSYEVLRSGQHNDVNQFFKLYDRLLAKNYNVVPMLQQMAEQYKENEKTKNQAVADKEKIEAILAKKAQGYQWYNENYGKETRKKATKGKKSTNFKSFKRRGGK